MSLSQLLRNNKVRYGLYIFAAQGLFMLCNLFINHWINKHWQVEGFSIFNLIKRISSFIVYPLLVGAGIGIPRYISFLKEHHQVRHYEYLLSGILIFCINFLGLVVVMLLFPSLLLSAFKTTAYQGQHILTCILLFIFSQGLFVLLTSYYRGRFQFGLMSFSNVLIMSLLPAASLFFVSDVFSYFYYYSIGTLFILIGALIYHRVGQQVSIPAVRLKSIRLFKYGYPRIIGEVSLFSLELMPLFLVSMYIGLAESGYMAMTFLLLKLGSTGYELAGSLLFPYFGKLFKNSTKEVFTYKVNQVLIVGILSSIVLFAVVYFMLPVALQLFFPSLIEAVKPSQIIFMVLPVYAVYLLLRNVLDITMDKAYNSINLSIAAVIQIVLLVVGIYFNNPNIYYILAIVVPYLVLGFLTYLVWLKTKRAL